MWKMVYNPFCLMFALIISKTASQNMTVTSECIRDGTSVTLMCKTTNFLGSILFFLNSVNKGGCTFLGCNTTISGYEKPTQSGTSTDMVISAYDHLRDGGDWTCSQGSVTSSPYKVELGNCETTTDGLSDGAKAGIAVACVTVIVIIVIIIFCRKPRGDPKPVPKVIVSILYYEIPKGYIVILLVVVESDTTVNEISWQKKVENEFIPIQLYLQPLKYKGSTPNEPSLTILDVRPGDSGVYKCSATNRYGTGQSTNTATVSVAANAQAYTTTVGSSVELLQSLCDTKNVTSVKWTHDRAQNLIFEDVDDLMYKGGNFKHPSLTIPWVSLEDVGTWRCFLETETLRRVIDAQLNIKEKHMEEKVGSKVVLFLELCEINGIEKVEWRHNNQAPDEHSNSLVNRRPSYTIEDAVCENSGTWLCILQLRNSPKSKKTYRVQLKVKDKGNSSLPPIKGVTNN